MLTCITNALLFAPEPRGRCDLLIGGGQILKIAPSSSKSTFLDAADETVDVNGAMVIPGLLDPHAHLTGGGGENGPETRVPAPHLNRFIEAGVTTVIGVLGTDGTTRTMRDLVARTYGVREDGLSAYCYTGNYEVPVKTLMASVRDDIVFVDPIIGVGELAIADHRGSQPTLHEVLRVASDCHVGGLMSKKAGVLHLHLGDGERGLSLVRQALEESEIPARVYYPTHVNRQKALFQEAAELAHLGCTVDITAFETGDEGYDVEEAIEAWLKNKWPSDRLTVSSDGGGCLPEFDEQGQMTHMDIGRPVTLFHALRNLLLAGHPPERIIPFFSTNAASLLRLSRKGRIRPHADADLLFLNEAYEIQHLMAMGQWLTNNGQITHTSSFKD